MASICQKCGKRMTLAERQYFVVCEACQVGKFVPKRFLRYLAQFHFDAIDCCYFYEHQGTESMYAIVRRGLRRYWAHVTSAQPDFQDCVFIPIKRSEIGEISVPDEGFRAYLLHNLVDPTRRPCLYTLDTHFKTFQALTRHVSDGIPPYPDNYVLLIDIATILYREFQRQPRTLQRELNTFWENLQCNWIQGITCIVFTDDRPFACTGMGAPEPTYRIGSKIQLQPDPRGGTKWRAMVTEFSGSGPQKVHRGLCFDPWRQAAPDLVHFFRRLHIPVYSRITGEKNGEK